MFFAAYGQVSCAIPATLDVIIDICESGMFGSIGAVAWIATVPTNVVHCAIPFALMLTPSGAGMDGAANGFPIDQSTCGAALIGFMLKWPMAENCT